MSSTPESETQEARWVPFDRILYIPGRGFLAEVDKNLVSVLQLKVGQTIRLASRHKFAITSIEHATSVGKHAGVCVSAQTEEGNQILRLYAASATGSRKDSTKIYDEAKAYGKRRAKDLVNAITNLIEAHPDLPEVMALEDAFTHIGDPFIRVVKNQETERFDALTEVIAELEHQQWAHWTTHMLQVVAPLFGNEEFSRDMIFSMIKSLPSEGLPAQKAVLEQKAAVESIERWERQIEVPYTDLSEAEKESDRQWARKVLDCLENHPARRHGDPKD
jgi:hypothetical protein